MPEGVHHRVQTGVHIKMLKVRNIVSALPTGFDAPSRQSYILFCMPSSFNTFLPMAAVVTGLPVRNNHNLYFFTH